MKRFFFAVFLCLLVFSSSAMALQEGVYYWAQNQAMYLELRGGLWQLVVPDENGNLGVYDAGSYAVSGNQVIFYSDYGRNEPPATIVDACTLSWGQSGNFIHESCLGSSGGSAYSPQPDQSGADPSDYVPMVVLDQRGLHLFIPQLLVPLGGDYGVVLGLSGQLVDQQSISFLVTGAQEITNPAPYLSGVFVPEYRMVYLPYVAVVDLTSGGSVYLLQNALFEVLMDSQNVYLRLYNIYQDAPTYGQYSQGGYSQGGYSQGGYSQGTGSYDPFLENMMFQTMSNIFDTMHNTNMAIINNIGSGWDLDYDY